MSATPVDVEPRVGAEPLRVAYEAAPAPGHTPAHWHDALAVVRYGAPDLPRAPGAAGAPATCIHVGMPAIDEVGELIEVWHAGTPVASGTHGPFGYCHDGHWLFCTMQIAAPEAAADLGAATQQAYDAVLGTARDLGFDHLYRLWHFIPDITGKSDGIERYWTFNRARQAALLAHRHPTAQRVPAATAVGVARGAALTIYLLAGKERPWPLENPRQWSAWRYPSEYGPQSPTFARACVSGHTAQLFVSGTASIVGHASQHPGDVVTQTHETLRNIRALLSVAADTTSHDFQASDLLYKVYVRRTADAPAIRATLREELALGTYAYLQADLCREDLLVEIEAVGLRPRTPAR